jgi:autotransporter-associated beta strand protein
MHLWGKIPRWLRACFSFLLISAFPASAQILYWDATDQTDGTYSGNTGNWLTANLWRNAADTANVSWTDGNIASFQVYRGYVTLNTAATVDGLEFTNNSGGYRIFGSGTITLNGGANDINLTSSGFTARIENNLTLAAASTWTTQGGGILFVTGNVSSTNQNLILNADRDMIISGVVGLGTGTVTKNGPGMVTLSGANTYTGGTTINAGTVNVANATGLGTGAVTLSGGTLQIENVTIANNITAATGTTLRGTGANARSNGTLTLANNAAYTFATSTTNPTDVFTIGNSDNDITGGNAATTIAVTGAGTVVLAGDATPTNNFQATFNLNSGTLSTSNDALLGNTANDINFNGGTLATTGTMTLNAGRVLTFNSGGGTLDVATGTTLTSGTAGQLSGSGALVKTGAGTLTVSQNNNASYTGSVTVNNGTMSLSTANGTMTGATDFTVNAAGTLTLTNAAGNNNNRVDDTATLTLQAGTFQYLGQAGASTETIGAMTLEAGSNRVNVQRNGGGTSAQLTSASLTRNAGATVNFTNTGGGGTLGNAGNNPRMIFTTAPTLNDGIIGGWAYVNNADFATYGVNGVLQLAAAGRPGTINTAVATDNVRVTGAQPTLTANRTINSLLYTGTFNTDLGGFTLTIDTGGLMKIGNNTLSITNGNLTAGTASGDELVAHIVENTTTISANIVDNAGGAMDLVKSGAGTLVLSGTTANTYTGITRVNEGTLRLNKTAGVDAIAGNVIIGDGAGTDTLQLSAANQISNASTVTVNRSGVFDLNGNNETISALIMEGGTTAATTGRVQTGAGTLTLGGDVTLNTNAQSLVSATIAGNLDLGGATRTFTIDDNTAISRDMDVSAVVSNGGVTKEGAGTLTFSGTSANTYTGTTTVNAGTLELNKTAGVNAVAGDTVISTGGTLLLAANNQIANTSNMTLSGGTFNTGGFTETLGTLTLTANSTIDMGNGSSVLTFSPTWTPAGNTLTILNWTGLVHGGGTDQIFFGNSQLFTTAQLASIRFDGYAPGAMQLSTGEIVPIIPETSTLVAGALVVLLSIFHFIRRRCVAH